MIIPADKQDPPTGGYRLKRGMKISELPPQPPLPPVPNFGDIDGAFQNAEYLTLLVRHDPHDIDRLVELPSNEGQTGHSPSAQEWIYEHIRRIPIDLTPLLMQLVSVCNRQTCPEMKAQEWLYLCAAHGGSGVDNCCAIDYIFHMLDSTTALLNSSKHFPSRLQIPAASSSHFPSLLRRLSRIFSHAYYHHREAFLLAESENSLYARFTALCTRYKLVDASLLFQPEEQQEIGRGTRGEVEREDEEGEGEGEGDGEDEDEDEDVEVDSDEERGVRGREKDDAAAPGRSHSLGRHPDPKTSLEFATLQPRKQASTSQAAPEAASDSTDEPSIGGTAIKSGKATLGRGKAGRGKMLWTAESVPESSTATMEEEPVAQATTEPATAAEPTVGEEIPASVGMARSDSRDSFVSAINVGPEIIGPATEDAEVHSTLEATPVETSIESAPPAKSVGETKAEDATEIGAKPPAAAENATAKAGQKDGGSAPADGKTSIAQGSKDTKKGKKGKKGGNATSEPANAGSTTTTTVESGSSAASKSEVADAMAVAGSAGKPEDQSVSEVKSEEAPATYATA